MTNGFVTLMGNPLKPQFENKSNVASPTTKPLSWQTESLSPIIDYKFKFRKVPTGNENFRKTGVFMWFQLTIPADQSSAMFHTKSYMLQGLQPATVYEVVVQARNQFGWSEDSKIVRFATPSESEFVTSRNCNEILIDESIQFKTNFPLQLTSSIAHQQSTASTKVVWMKICKIAAFKMHSTMRASDWPLPAFHFYSFSSSS